MRPAAAAVVVVVVVAAPPRLPHMAVRDSARMYMTKRISNVETIFSMMLGVAWLYAAAKVRHVFMRLEARSALVRFLPRGQMLRKSADMNSEDTPAFVAYFGPGDVSIAFTIPMMNTGWSAILMREIASKSAALIFLLTSSPRSKLSR